MAGLGLLTVRAGNPRQWDRSDQSHSESSDVRNTHAPDTVRYTELAPARFKGFWDD
jgi:hypothetical protein